jgi:hypothetical protein
MAKIRNVWKIVVEKPEWNRPLGRPRSRREDKEIGWDGVDWIHLVQEMDQLRTLVNTVMNLRVP